MYTAYHLMNMLGGNVMKGNPSINGSTFHLLKRQIHQHFNSLAAADTETIRSRPSPTNVWEIQYLEIHHLHHITIIQRIQASH